MQRQGNRNRLLVLGYVDVGGRVSPLATASVNMDRVGEVGSIRGTVYDSIRSRGLSGATVSILGTRYQTRTDRLGEFLLTNVPVGDHQLTFFHDDPTAWGLGSPLVTIEVEPELRSNAYLALPSFRQTARVLCMGSGAEAETVLSGHLVDANGVGLGNVTVELLWRETRMAGQAYDMKHEIRTGSDGRFVACTIPAEEVISVRANLGGRWVEGFEVTAPWAEIVYRRMMVPIGDR
jgi:hypothetical protein